MNPEILKVNPQMPGQGGSETVETKEVRLVRLKFHADSAMHSLKGTIGSNPAVNEMAIAALEETLEFLRDMERGVI